jgi:Tol biopolymer transport system component/tRNA A-37 threonylcarbamoyl transferase component Bud32
VNTIAELNEALVGRYEVEKQIGQGGMATVYLARDIRHDRNVAIKVLHPELAAVLGPERFIAEMKVTANLQHPHILPLFDSGTAGGQLFYVMPYIDGQTLRDRLEHERQLPIEEALRITTEVASALDYAHRHNVVHRDIKPENILLHDGSALVADFGIALAVSNAGGTRLTQTGLSLGTPQYMSPEQATGDKIIDGRTDVYSLGAVLYEMLAGEPPFTGPSSQAIVSRVLTEAAPPLRSRRNTVTPELEAAVVKSVQKLPADRFATPAAFADALRTSGTHTMRPIVGGSASQLMAAASSGRVLVVVAIVALIGGVIGFFAGRGSGADRGALNTEWSGELLGGPLAALAPSVSHDGQYVAFNAMVDGLTQLGVLKPKTGDWTILTTDRTRGLIADVRWSLDGSKIYYSRRLELPNGLYSISPLGTGDRLVLADADGFGELPDGSLLVERLNADRNMQLYRFYPGSGRLDTLDALVTRTTTDGMVHPFRDGKEVAFFGRPARQSGGVDHLFVMDIAGKKFRRLDADSLNLQIASLASTPDDQWVVTVAPSGNLSRLIAIARDGSGRIRTIGQVTAAVGGLDIGQDGSVYLDQELRPVQLYRYSPSDHKSESRTLAIYAGSTVVPLSLPDGRTLIAAPSGTGFRVMTFATGKEATPFVGTDESTNGPLAMLGDDRVLLTIGDGEKKVVAITSLASGQIIRRISDLSPNALAGSPDGKTIYFVDSTRYVWSMSADGSGKRTRLRPGDAVAVDPHGKYLIVEVDGQDKTRLFRVPLDGTREEEIMVHSDLHLTATGALLSNAVGPDGRIVISVVPRASWFWPAAILDPKTGKLEVFPPGDQFDSYGGWTTDGHIVSTAHPLVSTLWRFRPANAKK